jgi:putative transposase
VPRSTPCSTGERELGEVIEDVARLGARLIIQTALEAEVEVFLGRARYQRTAVTRCRCL